jgi:parallel beta-helix repeat protein
MKQQRRTGAVLARIALICAILTLSLGPIRGAAAVAPATIYVAPAPTGNDSNTGTDKLTPLATLQHALELAGPGTVIFLLDGVYPISQRIAWTTDVWPATASGSSSAMISVQPYPNAKPIFDCAPITTAATCITIGVQYAEIKGLEIKNSPNSGIAIMGGSHIRLRNNTIHHSNTQGIYVSDNDAGTLMPTDIVIDGNEVYNNSLIYPLPLTSASLPEGWASGIGIKHVATNVTITNNRVHHNNGEGIGISSKVGTLVSGNDIHDNFSVNLYINGARNATVERNFIYTSDTPTTYYRYNAPANGISVSNEHDPDATNTLSSLTIRNNIVVGGRYAFYYGGFERIAGGMKNSFIVNNTFYTNKAYTDSGNSATVFIGLDKDSAGNPANNHLNTKFFNNAVMHGATTGAIRTINDAILSNQIEFKHNGWYTLGSAAAGIGSGLNDKTTNPLFVNPGGVLAGTTTPLADYYKLTSASPLVSTGFNLGAGNDFWGDARPQGAGPEIGADEYAPTVAFAQASYTVMEGSTVVITIRLSQPMTERVNLSYATSNGSATAGEPCKGTCPTFAPNDYPAMAGFASFPVGQTEYSFSIPTYYDGVIEQNEYFRVTMSTPTNIPLGTPSTTLVYISDGNTEDQ